VVDAIFTNLAVHDVFPCATEERILLLEGNYFCQIVIWSIFNYNTFKTTLITWPFIFLVPYYFQVLKFAAIHD